MKQTGNTMFITGGTSGLGRGLAEAFHRLGNTVVIGARRAEALRQVCDANPGMAHVTIDVADPASIRAAADEVAARFPGLNVVVNNAGVQRQLSFAAGDAPDDAALVAEVNANLLGVIRCSAAFVPLLRGRPEAVLLNVSSGLAFAPLARSPIYCATKAAVHSFTMSLRRQLRDAGVRVRELVPPYVATELDAADRFGGPGLPGPQPMPLAAFVAEAMAGLATDADEVAVGTAAERTAAALAVERPLFTRMNG